MNKKTYEELDEELLSKIGGGFDDSDKRFLEIMIPIYRRNCPDVTLEEFLNRTVRKAYPSLNIEAASEKEVSEIREFLADFWK